MPSFLRQLSGREVWRSTSRRWGGKNNYSNGGFRGERRLSQMEGLGGDNNNGGLVMKKRVMVVVDEASHSKHAMMWALTHVANKADLLTLLHVIHPAHNASHETSTSSTPNLAHSLGSLCKACRPEVRKIYAHEEVGFDGSSMLNR